MTPRSTRALAGALAALALLAPHTADAQRLVAMNAPEGEAASQETGWSLASALASPMLEVRHGALEGTMARLRGEARSLHTAAVVPALLAVYASDPDVRCRLGAVVALHAIGDDTAMAELRRRIEEKSDYVGRNFATEARAIHDGTAPDRPIWGEARIEEARKLLEDGVHVAPLPFRPKRNTN